MKSNTSNTNMNKKQLGQFYTTNYAYILQNMYIPDNISNIIEPFAGAGDLLKFIYKDKATRLVKNEDENLITNILVKCIDDSLYSKIGLSIVDDLTKEKYIDRSPNLTARSYAILVIEPRITVEEQSALVDKFNTYLNEYRDQYNSLFLTNYRESNSIARKRISFGLVYEICGYLLMDA